MKITYPMSNVKYILHSTFFILHLILHSSFFIFHSSFKHEVHGGNEAEKSGEVVPVEALSLEEYIGNE